MTIVSYLQAKDLKERCEDAAFEEVLFGLEHQGDERFAEYRPGEDVILEGILGRTYQFDMVFTAPSLQTHALGRNPDMFHYTD